ncbi:regulatory protein, FmdB family [Thermodesulfatator indicus DSM 15286]|uniref:Regulatory protein, FmdB family n=1 Tax=Thermodesulfatator indicus (strain DSM 15286 / JCM 11887 / CIR29812) TaxID=667014 RepID=F8A845_THEID|nr:zinc ribbon domain-containing protein [Thermodesulfatator indicus]AEH45040.1 regulatory protein, FmdB family [Thermodesulfatator indicus DSM 15286]
MPIYEYRCLDCGKVSDHLVFNRDSFVPFCKHCGSKNMEKLISRVRVRLSLDSRLEKMADPSLFGSFDEEDPKSLKRMMDKFGAEFGDELGDDFDELIEGVEEEIESDTKSNTQETKDAD